MGRGPNSRPDKGFTRELQSRPEAPNKGKKEFTWNKPLVKPTAVDPFNTPARLANHRAVKPQAGEFANQTKSYAQGMKANTIKPTIKPSLGTALKPANMSLPKKDK